MKEQFHSEITLNFPRFFKPLCKSKKDPENVKIHFSRSNSICAIKL